VRKNKDTEKKCKKHGFTTHAIRKSGRIECRKCATEKVSKRRRRLKEDAVLYKGGKCCKCGYSKCLAALAFHHLDPKEKEFRIGNKNIKSWERIRKELDKCILVCHNCHAEIHHNNIPG